MPASVPEVSHAQCEKYVWRSGTLFASTSATAG